MRIMKPLAENIHISDDGTGIEIVDQTALPGTYQTKVIRSRSEMIGALRTLEVRGAPAIGIFAAYCLYALAEKQLYGCESELLLATLRQEGEALKQARPTAVNLAWAVDRMMAVAQEVAGRTNSQRDGRGPLSREAQQMIVERLGDEAVAIQQEDIDMCRAISEHGLSLLKDGDGILTHCNAGPLATSRYGTALGPLLLGKEQGMDFHVFADETRPLLQGARLTAYELAQAGIDVTLICDNMASTVMKQGKIQACLVGCDRVAANGDVANKIGTSGVAILAKHYGIPFYVLGPSSTVDLDCPSGEDIPIELRPEEEIRTLHYEQPMAPEGVPCYNPAFDVTDHSLITAIITEKGVLKPPYKERLV